MNLRTLAAVLAAASLALVGCVDVSDTAISPPPSENRDTPSTALEDPPPPPGCRKYGDLPPAPTIVWEEPLNLTDAQRARIAECQQWVDAQSVHVPAHVRGSVVGPQADQGHQSCPTDTTTTAVPWMECLVAGIPMTIFRSTDVLTEDALRGIGLTGADLAEALAREARRASEPHRVSQPRTKGEGR